MQILRHLWKCPVLEEGEGWGNGHPSHLAQRDGDRVARNEIGAADPQIEAGHRNINKPPLSNDIYMNLRIALQIAQYQRCHDFARCRRIKALGLHWRGPKLLAFEVYDHEGRLKGVRPLGGGVEFGESAKDAVIREFKEEIDTDVSVLAGSMVLENVFVHEGEQRHEILFIFDLAFPE
ncbi:hypothetical protein AGR1A_Lc120018 [Agrobacterium fabacearum CFBP 5771]|nr:hypothetical protein AGR1A_Lc120018 [Agrobacterium fabacearum CFBP 5771]